MSKSVAEAVAAYISNGNGKVRLMWHGGEPLSCGVEHLSSLFEIFEELRAKGLVWHTLQTNATLITDKWCAFFKKYNVAIGVSIDGPEWANTSRINWSGQEMYQKIRLGIQKVEEHKIPFTSICVVTDFGLNHAQELYEFFCDLGCIEVGFNIEEKIGIHSTSASDNEGRVTEFWKNLFLAWKANPKIQVRELRRTLEWIANPSNPYKEKAVPVSDVFPSVAFNGKVVFLSPEFLDAKSKRYKDFEAGNILNESFESIVEKVSKLPYFLDFIQGIELCKNSCSFFDFCRGSQASNKYFELGTTNGTETTFCRNSEQRLLNGVLAVL